MEGPWIPSAVSFRTNRSIHVEETIETVSENAKEILERGEQHRKEVGDEVNEMTAIPSSEKQRRTSIACCQKMLTDWCKRW